jgi:hypothetical protein
MLEYVQNLWGRFTCFVIVNVLIRISCNNMLKGFYTAFCNYSPIPLDLVTSVIWPASWYGRFFYS